MALRLEIVSAHRQSLGERASKEFGRKGGTIGRSLQSDWVLPDAMRYVSSRHASIDFRSGSYYLVDMSTNGVYVNDAEQPVGRGKPQRLFSGDRLRLGEYEILVHLDEANSATEPASGSRHVDPVDLAQRVAPPEEPGADLVDPFEITGVGFDEIRTEDDDFDPRSTVQLAAIELRIEDEPAPRAPPPARPAAPAAAKPAAPKAAAKAAERKPSQSAPAPAPPAAPRKAPAATAQADAPSSQAASERGAGGPLAAFFRGAGIDPSAMEADQAEVVLQRAGQLMRELILGVIESLQIRAEQKTALRLPNTTIQRKANNPLKFSAGIDEALGNLFFRQAPEYLSAVDAVRDALRDIKLHQQLLLSALPNAVTDYVGRLDPEELEQKFSGGKRGALMAAANKLRYWDLYKDLYQVVANHAAGQLPPQFIEELARAYEQESSRSGHTPDRTAANAAS